MQQYKQAWHRTRVILHVDKAQCLPTIWRRNGNTINVADFVVILSIDEFLLHNLAENGFLLSFYLFIYRFVNLFVYMYDQYGHSKNNIIENYINKKYTD